MVGTAVAQHSYSIFGSTYQQDFNGLGTTIATVTSGDLNNLNASLNGWYFLESGSNANTIIAAGTGSGNGGDTYNFGASGGADRTLGGLRSGSLITTFGFHVTNNTGQTISAIQIGYTGKTWRVGTANRSDRLDFQYSTNATSLSTGTWVDVNELDYANPGQATTGSGSVQHSAAISHVISGLNIPNGSTLFIRWQDVDVTGADDGMGVDDFSFAAQSSSTITIVDTGFGDVFGPVYAGEESASSAFVVSASGLDIDLFISAPTGFEVSLDDIAWSSGFVVPAPSGTVEPTNIHVRFAPVTAGAFAGDVLCYSGFASEAVPVSGAAISAPTVQDFDIAFSAILTSGMDISWTNGNGDRRIVVMNTTNSFTEPANGFDPIADPTYGVGEQVVYNGTGSSVTVSGLTPNTEYWVRVFACNAAGSLRAYNTTTAASNPASQFTIASSAPTKLVVSSINGGDPVVTFAPFTITVQSVDANDVPQAVSQNTNVELTVFDGVGTLTGTTTATILAGTHEVVYGLFYGEEELALVLQAAALTGDVLAPAFSPGFPVLGAPAYLEFSGLPSSAFTDSTLASFTVTARRNDASTSTEFSGAITLAVTTGPGSLTGTVSVNAVNGVATFSNIAITAPGFHVLQATAGAFNELTGNGGITITNVPALTEVIVPQYIQGIASGSSNNERVPYAALVTLNNLLPNALYRYTNQMVNATDGPTSQGAGIAIYAAPAGFVRATTTSLGVSGQYGEFTAGPDGTHTGWFIVETSGNIRFLTSSGPMALRIRLNNGAGGNMPVSYLTTTSPVTLLAFGSAAGDATGIRSTTGASPRNFVCLYDNLDGTGRPLAATFVESDGTPAASNVAFYTNDVNAVNGAFGTLIPNTLPNGVRRIEQRSLDTGALVGCPGLAPVGVWTGGVSTVNPNGGVIPRVISSGDLPFAPASDVFYADADGDGFGDPNVSVVACTQPAGYVSNSSDCNDAVNTIWVGATCDDGDVETINDAIDANCLCVGIPANLDCEGVPDGTALPGTPCDDGNTTTVNDEWDLNCDCVGIPLDCEGVPNGPAQPGSPCNDADPTTGNDTWGTNCICAGLPLDCLGVPGGTALPGTPCDDGDLGTQNDTYQANCTCAGTPISFTAGNLVVLQAGNGTGSLASTGNPVVIREFTTAGTSTLDLPIPSTGTDPLVVTGVSTTEGTLSLSGDGTQLVFAGYSVAIPNLIVLGTSSATAIPRVVATLDAAGSYQRAVADATVLSGAVIRGGASDGSNLWLSGGAQGVHYIAPGTPALIATGKANLRASAVFNGQLYVSSASTAGTPGLTGVFAVGVGTPTTQGQSLSTIAATSSGTTNGFHFSPAGDVLYVAIGTGGIQKWVNSGTWSLAYTMTFSAGALNVVADHSGTAPVVYLVSNNGTQLLRIDDPGTGIGNVAVTPVLLATAPANTAWRGINFAPQACTELTWYADADGDGFGDPNSTQLSCTQPSSYVANADDTCPLVAGVIGSTCDDGDPNTTDDVLDATCNCVGTAVNEVRVSLSAALGGAFVEADGLMRDNLRSLPAFPLGHPYGGTPLLHAGTETVAPSVLAVSGTAAVVDWVLLELRSGSDPSVLVSTRAALMLRNGLVVDTDGSSSVLFSGTAPGSYYIAVRHRNHLGIMTAGPEPLGGEPVLLTLDGIGQACYTLPNQNASAPRVVIGSVAAMWPGNVNPDDQVKYLGAGDDRDPVLGAIGGTVLTTVVSNVYHSADVNLNGEVKYLGAGDDRDPILGTIGGTILNSVRYEQLP